MTQTDTTLIVPVHGQLDLLRKCLDSIDATASEMDVDVLLVDDATPGGIETVASEFDNVSVLVRPEQGGFSAAVNDGLRRVNGDYRHIVLVNSDMELMPGCLTALKERVAQNPKAGIVGGMELSPDDPNLIMCGGHRPVHEEGKLTDLFRLDRTGRLDAGELQTPEKLDWVSFGIVLLDSDCVKTVGDLDETFLNYFSDADYCMRAKFRGFDVWYEPDARVLHKRHASTQLSKANGVVKMQEDRERFCKKWNLEQVSLPMRQRRWIKWMMNARTIWRPALIPHLAEGADVPQGTEALLRRKLSDPAALDTVAQAETLIADGKRRDVIQAWCALYLSGLARIEAVEPLAEGQRAEPFMEGVDIEVVAPHYDDAAISLGGMLGFRSSATDTTTVRVVFGKSGFAVDPLSDLPPGDIEKLRKFEEAVYCANIGASFSFGDVPDRLVRHPHKPIMLESHQDLETDLIAEVAESLISRALSQPRMIFMVPLAAGLMADHAIVAAAAAMAVRKGIPAQRFLVYDDLPYADVPGAIDKGLALYRHFGFELSPHVIDVSRWFEAKCENISVYASQYNDEMLEAIERHGRSLGVQAAQSGEEDWRRGERLWRISGNV